MMTDQVKYALIGITAAVVAGILYFVYNLGYDKARTEADLEISAMKEAQALAIVEAQKKESAKYEERIKNLVADVERLGADNADWLRKQNAFVGAKPQYDACLRERSELARLAVEGRELLEQATIRFKFCCYNNGS